MSAISALRALITFRSQEGRLRFWPMNSVRESLVIAVATALTAAVATLATFSHAPHVDPWPAIAAATSVLFALLPPLYLRRQLSNGAARQMAVIAWRLPAMLASLLLANQWDGLSRKCFIAALMACYFVTLPLESWLLIRECKPSDSTPSESP